MGMTQMELIETAEKFLREEFDLMLEVPLEINNRLTSTMGRVRLKRDRNDYKFKPYSIQISGTLARNEETSITVDVLKHECVHYALVMLGLPFKDTDDCFIDTCNSLGVGLTGEVRAIREYECTACKRKMLVQEKGNYTHKPCQAKLKFIGLKYQ